jgi:hypothetical protein
MLSRLLAFTRFSVSLKLKLSVIVAAQGRVKQVYPFVRRQLITRPACGTCRLFLTQVATRPHNSTSSDNRRIIFPTNFVGTSTPARHFHSTRSDQLHPVLWLMASLKVLQKRAFNSQSKPPEY